MTKYISSRTDGPWSYPTLGFIAAAGAIVDSTLHPLVTGPPDAYWSVYGGGSAETGITTFNFPFSPGGPTPLSTDGYVYLYDGSSNTGQFKDPSVLSQGFNVRRYGAKGDGVHDDTAAFNSAIAAAAAVAVSGLSNRFNNKPTIVVPAGTYRITAALTVISFVGLRVVGDGSVNTAIVYDSVTDAVVWDIGTFSATPSDIFTGVASAEFRGIRIQVNNPGVAGSRFAQAIRSSGGGSLVLKDVAVMGFKYGVNSPYGGDFNTYTDTLAEYCDTGYYQGPGGQQFLTVNMNAFGCVEGIVLDRFDHAHMVMPILNSCSRAGVLIEAITDTSTRQLTSFTAAGTTYQSTLVLDTPWFEGNAGNLGSGFIPTNFIECSAGSASDAYRDVQINSPFIVAGNVVGGGSPKTTTAFFANTSGLAAQRVYVTHAVFQGAMTRWFTGPAGPYVLDQYRITTGYTAPAFANTSVGYRVNDSLKQSTGLLPLVDVREDATASQGTAMEYGINGITRMGFLNAGSYLYRLGFDIQNRKIFLDDPSTAASASISRSAAMPTAGSFGIGSFVHNTAPVVTAGKVLLGWVRLTTGSAHVAGTDWTPFWGTTT